jgi:hypothetical protein
MVRFALWAHSQSEPSAETWLKAAARTINDHDDAWGVEVRIKYLGQGNPLAPYIAADLRRRQERRGGVERQPRQSIRAVSVGGAHEVDIASRHYKELLKPKTWDAEGKKRGPVTQYSKDGVKRFTAEGRQLPNGDMTIVGRLMLKLNHRQRVVYQDMVLTDPPLSRAEIARKLNIADVTQISRIWRQAEAKMTKWLLAIERKPK